MLICLQNCLNIFDLKVVPASEIIFIGNPYSANIILVMCTRSSAVRAHILHNRELAVVGYNAQNHFIINHENVSSDHPSCSGW